MEASELAARSGAGVVGAAGLVLTAINTVTAISDVVSEHFWLLISISVLLGIVATWPKPTSRQIGFTLASAGTGTRRKSRKYQWPIVVAVLGLAVSGVRTYRQWHPVQLPRGSGVQDPTHVIPEFEHPLEIATSNRFRNVSLVNGASATAVSPPRLISFGLSSEKTSYREAHDRNISEEMGAPYYALAIVECDTVPVKSPRQGGRIPISGPCFKYKGDCDGVQNKNAVLEALRAFVRRRGRVSKLEYLENYAVLKNLVAQRADVLRDILPDGDEWLAIPVGEGRATIQRWYRDCVGLMYPVFRIVIQNPNPHETLVKAVRYYRIRYTGGAAGSRLDGGAVLPAASYAHEIIVDSFGDAGTVSYHPVRPAVATYLQRFNESHDRPRNSVPVAEKPQSRDLDPVLRISPRGSVAFEIQLYPRGGNDFAGTLFGMDIVTSDGVIRVPEFWLSFMGTVG